MRNKPKATSTATPPPSANGGCRPGQGQGDRVIALVAKDVLGLDTLLPRGLDRLDFHDLSVHQIRRALGQAYDLGREFTPDRDPSGPGPRRPRRL